MMSDTLQEAIQKCKIKAKWNEDKAIELFIIIIFIGSMLFVVVSIYNGLILW